MDGRSSFARPEKEAATATAAKARQATTARDPQGQVTPAQGAATGGSGHGAAASYGERDAAKQRDRGRRGTQQLQWRGAGVGQLRGTGFHGAPADEHRLCRAGGSELTTRACGGGPSRDGGSSEQHGYGKRAWVGSETDVKEPMAEHGERPGQGTAVVELEPELGRAKAGAARAVERGRGE
jgi:hypothetical protein